MNSLLYPALQKFYNALKQLRQFSLENSFFDNIGCLDTFFMEYRSVTFAVQKSLGAKDHPVYIKNLEKFLKKDVNLSKWFIDQRNVVDHEHPFGLKKVLRIVLYGTGNAVVFKQYVQTVDREKPIGNYLQTIRDTFQSIQVPDVYFSVQYLFLDENDVEEKNIFDLVEKGLWNMLHFLHAMKLDLKDESDVATELMRKVDVLVQEMPQRWMIDALDYCYYKSTDRFERGELYSLVFPGPRMPVWDFLNLAKSVSASIISTYDAFVYLHALVYVQQQHQILSTFFVEFSDGTYQIIAFSASIRTTMYRYINRVAEIIKDNQVENVYLVTEMVKYGSTDFKKLPKFLKSNYEERKAFRVKTFLTFYKISNKGIIDPIMIDTDELVDKLSVSVAMGKLKSVQSSKQLCVVLTPIVDSFRAKKR